MQPDSYLQVIVNTVLDGLMTIDHTGAIQTFNMAAIRIFGYQPEEVIGRNVKMLMPEPYHSEHDCYLRNYLRTGEKKVIGIGREVSGRRKDGSVFPMELGINEVEVEGRRIFVGTVRDITDRKAADRQLKEEAARMQAVMNTVLDGLITLDECGAVLTFNPAAARIFSYQPEEVIGRNVKMLMPEPYHSEHDCYLRNYLGTGEKKVIGIGREVSGRRKDGSVFPMELGINEVEVEGRRIFVGTVRDLSERKSMLASLSSQMTAISKTQAVVEFSMDGTIITANQNFLDLMRYDLDEIQGRHHSMFVSDDFRESEEYEKFWAMLRRGDYQTAEYMRLGKGGRETWLLSFYNPVTDVNGKPWKVVKFSVDITERKMAERQLKSEAVRMLAVMNTVLDGLITIDDRGTILTFNPAAARIFGYRLEEIVGENVRTLMPEPYRAEHDGYLRNYLGTGERKVIGIGREVSGKRKDGSVFPMELGINEMKIDGRRMFVGTVRDITERKEVERMKNEFISIVSHELRTPLTSIRGSLGLIVGAMARDLPPKVMQLTSIAHKNSERLILLINDILDIDKIAAGEMRFDIKRQSLASLMRQAAEANQSYADKFRIAIKARCVVPDVEISVDADRFVQVFSNLLSNAAKFSPEGSAIRFFAEAGVDKVRISVADNGPGIPKDFHGRIFQKFSQVDSSATRAKGGSGLGLHISKLIVENMAGAIGFDTVPGQGTTFWVEFPAADQARTMSNVLVRSGSGRMGYRVLVCAADKAVAGILCAQLKTAGFAAAAVATVAEARRELAEHSYVAVTLDLAFASGNAPDFIRELRGGPGTTALPIVAVTATANGTTLHGDAFGVVDWLVKPVDADDLRRALQAAIAAFAHNGAPPHILHVGDAAGLADILAEGSGGAAELARVSSLADAQRRLLQDTFDMIVLDLDVSDGDSMVTLADLHDATGMPVPVFILSAAGLASALRREATTTRTRMSETKVVETILSLVHANIKESVS